MRNTTPAEADYIAAKREKNRLQARLTGLENELSGERRRSTQAMQDLEKVRKQRDRAIELARRHRMNAEGLAETRTALREAQEELELEINRSTISEQTERSARAKIAELRHTIEMMTLKSMKEKSRV